MSTEERSSDVDTAFGLTQAQISKIGTQRKYIYNSSNNKEAKEKHSTTYPSYNNDRCYRKRNDQQQDNGGNTFLFNNRLVDKYYDCVVGVCNSRKTTPYVFANRFTCENQRDDDDDDDDITAEVINPSATTNRGSSSDNASLNNNIHGDKLNQTLMQMELEESVTEMMTLQEGLALDLLLNHDINYRDM